MSLTLPPLFIVHTTLIMHSLSLKFIDSLNFTSSHLADLRKLGEFRAKQDLFNKKSKEALKILKDRLSYIQKERKVR